MRWMCCYGGGIDVTCTSTLAQPRTKKDLMFLLLLLLLLLLLMLLLLL